MNQFSRQFMKFPGLLNYWSPKPPWDPPGVGQICLGSNDSRINPHMRAKFVCSQMVVSDRQTDTHTQRDTAALYSRWLFLRPITFYQCFTLGNCDGISTFLYLSIYKFKNVTWLTSYFICLYVSQSVSQSVSPSLPLVRFGQLLCCADKRIYIWAILKRSFQKCDRGGKF